MPQDDDDRFDDQASRPDPFTHEDKDDLFNPAVDESRLPGDYDRSPAAPPDDVKETLSKADPRTDSGLDADEIYDEGLTSASDIDALMEDSDDDNQPVRIA
ncbi:MAG TPA: hypothetical protein VF466_03705 [Candidatus Saccharimonadales bacterium]